MTISVFIKVYGTALNNTLSDMRKISELSEYPKFRKDIE